MAKSLVKQTLSKLPFKVGDKAVYPAHGVGEVKSIESKEILGAKQTFYVLQILDSGMKIMVPTTNINAVGLREVISDTEVDDVYEILKQRDVQIDNQTWNRRYREYMDKIKTGSVYEIAEVLRDLSILKFKKELSFGERKMLDTAKNLLVKELAICEDREEEEIEEEIYEIFKAL
jgi:CarD family transcriptional regulator